MKKSDFKNIPGWELVSKGLKDISEGNYSTVHALLIFMAAPRLHFLGFNIPDIPKGIQESPSHALYKLLENTTSTPYSEYNALQRRLASFCSGVENT
ncbi:MAG: hypothetical protein HYS07_06815 [Chlamydiae bacterium]|nr:hypothetical protein [Chlamydiota bacterium]MBI3276390.1 hypothetical protein [Chlamydiota bacterium]